MEPTLRRAIARLVAAMMVADGRLATEEIDEAARLDHLGLGSLAPLVDEELQRATRVPIDVAEACAALAGTGAALVGTVLSVLADVAASDGTVDADEARLFAGVAARLGADIRDIRWYLHLGGEAEPATPPSPGAAAKPAPPPSAASDEAVRALRALGLEPGASRADLDSRYVALVGRYDPATLGPLGAEFVALAVKKLATLTRQYELARDATER